VHTFTVTLKTAGGRALTATDTVMGSLTGTQTGIQVNPAPASTLNVAGFPSPVTAGAVQFFTVTAEDAYGNTASSYRGTVHFTSSDRLALFSPDYAFTAADSGSHTFGAAFRTVGTQAIIATDTADRSVMGTQGGIVVNPAAPDHLTVTTSVNSTVAGTPFDVTVIVQDQFNNTVTGYTGTMTFSSGDPYGATLPPAYTFQPGDRGRVTFAGGATLYTAGTWDVTVTDTASGISGTANVVVTPAPAVALAITAPTNAASGTPFDVTVTALDPYGNTDINYQGTVTWTTTDPDPGVQLPADYAFQPSDAGMVTFPGGVTLITAGDQTITATDTDSGITGSAIVTVLPPGSGSGPGPRTRKEMAEGVIQASQILPAMGVRTPGADGTRLVEVRPWHLTRQDVERFFTAIVGEGQRIFGRGCRRGDFKMGPVIPAGLLEEDGAELFWTL
jgi:hypothetical protein